MSTEIKVPAVGESISSGVLSVWLKKDGEPVKANEPVFTLETDKISTEVVAETAGTLVHRAAEGDEVKVGQVVALIEPAGAPAAAAPAPAPAPASPAAAAAAKPSAADNGGSAGLSPAVRRLVEEQRLDPAQIAGTGKGGRLTKEDVLRHGEESAVAPPRPGSDQPVRPAPPAPAAAPAPVAAPDPAPPSPAPAAPAGAGAAAAGTAAGRTSRRKLSPLRRKIAAQLVAAQQTAAILTTFNECDMSGIMALRSRVQDAFVKKHGTKLGFMSFFVKAAVEALRAVPAVNGRLEGEEFVQNHYYDLGVAVGTDRGLVVPVIRDADRKGFAQLEKELAQYAVRAREGKLAMEDLQGGVFTISNGGVYGSLLSTPILNPPQSGILGMHNIVSRPVAVDGQVVIRPMMYLALSYDHRVVDGKEAVSFLVRIKECVEDPTRLLLEI